MCLPTTTVLGVRGGVRQRRQGVWEVRIEAGRDALTGRRIQVSRSVHGTKRDAQRLLNALLAAQEAGHGGHGSTATLRHLIDQWLTQSAPDLSPTTLRRYRSLISCHIDPALGDRAVHRIKTEDLDRFYLALLQRQGLSPSSIRQVHAILRRALRHAVKWGWLTSNPASNATPPRLRSPGLQPPDPTELAKLLHQAEQVDPAFGHFLHLAATTGARRGELCALRWRDIDFSTSRLSISKAIIEVPGGLAEKDTKTHASRTISLDTETVRRLKALHRAAVRSARLVAQQLRDDAFVFSTDPASRIPWTPGAASKRFQSIRDATGLRRVRLHDLRHFTATRLLAEGVPVRTVSGRLGHSNPTTTLNVYAHFLAEGDRSAASIIGRIVSTRPRLSTPGRARTPTVASPRGSARGGRVRAVPAR